MALIQRIGRIFVLHCRIVRGGGVRQEHAEDQHDANCAQKALGTFRYRDAGSSAALSGLQTTVANLRKHLGQAGRAYAKPVFTHVCCSDDELSKDEIAEILSAFALGRFPGKRRIGMFRHSSTRESLEHNLSRFRTPCIL